MKIKSFEIKVSAINDCGTELDITRKGSNCDSFDYTLSHLDVSSRIWELHNEELVCQLATLNSFKNGKKRKS